MIFGFNTDVKSGDTVYHVQSEAREHERILQTPEAQRSPRDRFFHNYLLHYTNAATIVNESFRDTQASAVQPRLALREVSSSDVALTLCLVVAGRHLRGLEAVTILLGDAPSIGRAQNNWSRVNAPWKMSPPVSPNIRSRSSGVSVARPRTLALKPGA